ncbi:uncharacterized protein LOC135377061, partial [Ornithodoros turicata]
LRKIQAVDDRRFPILRQQLQAQVKERFGNVLLETPYVVSALLHPNIKTRLFDRKTLTPSMPQLCSSELAKQLLSAAVEKFNAEDCENDQNSASEEMEAPSANSIFAFLDEVARPMSSCQTEVEQYLQAPPQNADPLQFWKKNSPRFPALSKTAKCFLGLPASSGDVERLFCIAGSLKRARRASLSIAKVAEMLLYWEHRIPSISRNLGQK